MPKFMISQNLASFLNLYEGRRKFRRPKIRRWKFLLHEFRIHENLSRSVGPCIHEGHEGQLLVTFLLKLSLIMPGYDDE